MSDDPINKDLVYNFFSIYSRLEYALKQAGFRKRKNERDNSVEADWKSFVSKLAAATREELKPVLDAGQYILSNPPQREILDSHDELDWQPSGVGNRNIIGLCGCLSCIRNNLFHGGKYRTGLVEGAERNTALLNSAINVINAILDLKAAEKVAFWISR